IVPSARFTVKAPLLFPFQINSPTPSALDANLPFPKKESIMKCRMVWTRLRSAGKDDTFVLKRHFVMIVFTTALVLVGSLFAAAAELNIPYVDASIAVDASLSEEAWQKAYTFDLPFKLYQEPLEPSDLSARA